MIYDFFIKVSKVKPIILNFISFIEEIFIKWLICLKIIIESITISGILVLIDVSDVGMDVSIIFGIVVIISVLITIFLVLHVASF